MTDLQTRLAALEKQADDYKARYEYQAEERRRVREERDALRKLILLVLPECAVCPECGPFVRIDEDGCCTMCGRATRTMETKEVLGNERPRGELKMKKEN